MIETKFVMNSDAGFEVDEWRRGERGGKIKNST